jgi:hypothetical protein
MPPTPTYNEQQAIEAAKRRVSRAISNHRQTRDRLIDTWERLAELADPYREVAVVANPILELADETAGLFKPIAEDPLDEEQAKLEALGWKVIRRVPE